MNERPRNAAGPKDYETPEDLARDPQLTTERKIELLRRWEYDQRELSVALEEGMPGPEPELLDRIRAALAGLTRGEPRAPRAPTKQGGADAG